MPKRQNAKDGGKPSKLPLSFFACPNGDCADFNRFDSANLSVAEWMGKDNAIRRLYCKSCGTRFSERQGLLMQHTKLPEAGVVRIIKLFSLNAKFVQQDVSRQRSHHRSQ